MRVFVRVLGILGILLLVVYCIINSLFGKIVSEHSLPEPPFPAVNRNGVSIGDNVLAVVTSTSDNCPGTTPVTITVSVTNTGATVIDQALDEPIIDILVGDKHTPSLRWTDTLDPTDIPYTLHLQPGESKTYLFKDVIVGPVPLSDLLIVYVQARVFDPDIDQVKTSIVGRLGFTSCTP